MTDDLAIIVSTTIAMGGWLVNSYLNRKHRIFEIRTEKRISMFKDVDSVQTELRKRIVEDGKKLAIDHDLNTGLNKAYTSVLLYGYEDEIELYKNFIDALEQKDIEKIKQTVSCFDLFREKLRREIGFPKPKSSGALK